MKSILPTRRSTALLLAFSCLTFLETPSAPAQCCGRVSQNQPRIVGGTTAARGAYPWMTALVERGQTPSNGQFCGAALIAPQWVLTAAHCIEGTTAARLDVVIGAYDLREANGSGQRVQVTQIIRHPSYGEVNGTLSHDLALLKLATPVSNVPVLRLIDSANRTASGQPCKGMGFGATTEGGNTSPVLLHVDLAFVTQSAANAVYGGITDAHLGAGIAGGGRDTCQGDSGGPLVVSDGLGGWFHAGVVSFGDGCARAGVPGIYTNTLKYVPWINQQIGSTPTPATDDYGNTLATAFAATAGTALTGRLEAAGDLDYFKFTVTAPGTLTAASTGTTALRGQWFNASGTAVASQTGAPAINSSVPVNAGTWYLAISGAASTTTGTYGLTTSFTATPVTGTPEIELTGLNAAAIADGDTAPSAAKGTAFATTATGSTATQVFTIRNSGTASLTLGTPQLTGTGAGHFAIIVPPVSTLAAGRTAAFTLAFSPKAAGTHVAEFSLPNNDANENPYNFRLTGTATAAPATGDDHGNTAASATLLAVPASRPGVIGASLDVDWFRFTVAKTTTLTLRTTGSTDTYARVFDSNSKLITQADDYTDLNFRIRRTFAPGTYLLEVSGYDARTTGAYTLSVAP
jgi:secreted trypsin-like serine protease